MKNWRASFCVPTWLLAHVRFQILALIYTVSSMKGQDSIQFKFILSKTEPYAQFYRIKGGGGSPPPPPPPTDSFSTVNHTPTNYISLEREFNRELDSF